MRETHAIFWAPFRIATTWNRGPRIKNCDSSDCCPRFIRAAKLHSRCHFFLLALQFQIVTTHGSELKNDSLTSTRANVMCIIHTQQAVCEYNTKFILIEQNDMMTIIKIEIFFCETHTQHEFIDWTVSTTVSLEYQTIVCE